MVTEVVETVKPAGGGAFTTLQAWEAALPASPVANDEIRTAECFSGGNLSDGSTSLTINGQTTDLTRYLVIRAAPGDEHKGTGRVINKDKAYFETDADVNGTDIRTNHTRILDVQFTSTSAMNANLVPYSTFLNSFTLGQNRVTRCIIEKGDNVNGSVLLLRGGGNSNHQSRFESCFIIGNGVSANVGICQHARVSAGNTGRTRYHNCTIISRGGSTFVLRSTLDHRVFTKNCYLKGANTIYSGPAEDFGKGGGDATSNAEAVNPIYRNIPFSDDNFADTTSGSEDIHLVQSGILSNGGDNIVNFNIPGVPNDETDPNEYVVLFDWEGDILQLASGILPNPGSGGYPIGADGFGNDVGPDSIGGYTEGLAGGEPSGFIGGYILGGPFTGPTGIIGGYCLAKAVTGNELFGIVGGYIEAPGGVVPPNTIGGFVFSIPLTDEDPRIIGGFASGLTQNTGTIGGCTFGKPETTQFVAARARTLVAVTSDNVPGQNHEFDAQIIFKQFFQNSFNAKLDNAKTFLNQINAKVEVQKFKIPPTVFIQSVTLVPGSGEVLPSGQPVPNFDSGGARKVCVVASGFLGDGVEFTSAHIDFGDPFINDGNGFKPGLSVSGFTGPPPWSTCHDYDMSGLYLITARAQDELGMVGMDVSGLNLASGAVQGTDFPLISISGLPRFGIVPPSLEIAFTTVSSGLFSPPYTAAQSSFSEVQAPTDDRILWSFGNRETSRRKDPATVYNSPGLYAPTLRFFFQNPSGQGPFMISDTLLIGFNR